MSWVLLVVQSVYINAVERPYLKDVLVCIRRWEATKTTYAEAISVKLGLVKVPKIDRDARSALWAEQLVLFLGVEAVDGAAGEGIAVPLDVLAVWV